MPSKVRILDPPPLLDELFPEGAYVVGEVTAVTEYQSQEDKARNRPGAAGCADTRFSAA